MGPSHPDKDGQPEWKFYLKLASDDTVDRAAPCGPTGKPRIGSKWLAVPPGQEQLSTKVPPEETMEARETALVRESRDNCPTFCVISISLPLAIN
jgi:hypothetical protein